MPILKLAPHSQSFKITNCGEPEITNIFNKIFAASYILSACLIIYSLLLFNLAWAGGSGQTAVLPESQTLKIPVLAYLPNMEEVWLQTAIVAEATGNTISDSLDQTIQIYSNGLTKLFVATGNILSAIPTILTSPPSFARANST